jgi:uncharacterized protein (TIGR02271 family)
MNDMKTTQRATVVGLFHSRSEAERAVAELKRERFTDEQISLVGKNADGEVKADGDNMAGTGAATGMAIGAGTAALVSLGITFGVIPVIGPILAMGPLGAALISAAGGLAAGGLIGGLVGMGIPEHEAKYYEGEVKSGRFLVTVKAEARSAEAWAVMQRLGAYNHETTATASKGVSPAPSPTGERNIKLQAEELKANKVAVENDVRVRKEIITEHKTMDVPVEREEVVIERRPMNKSGKASEIKAEEIRIPVKEERVNVTKEAVVTEEVTIGKKKHQETKRVEGDVRKEELKVDRDR